MKLWGMGRGSGTATKKRGDAQDYALLQELRRTAVDRAETAFVPNPALGSGPKSAGPSSALSFRRESSRGGEDGERPPRF